MAEAKTRKNTFFAWTYRFRFPLHAGVSVRHLPWPQKPKHEDIKAVAEAAVTLRALRQETMRKLNYSLPPRAIFRLVFSV